MVVWWTIKNANKIVIDCLNNSIIQIAGPLPGQAGCCAGTVYTTADLGSQIAACDLSFFRFSDVNHRAPRLTHILVTAITSFLAKSPWQTYHCTLHYQPSTPPIPQTVYCSANDRLKYYNLSTCIAKKKRNMNVQVSQKLGLRSVVQNVPYTHAFWV